MAAINLCFTLAWFRSHLTHTRARHLDYRHLFTLPSFSASLNASDIWNKAFCVLLQPAQRITVFRSKKKREKKRKGGRKKGRNKKKNKSKHLLGKRRMFSFGGGDKARKT